MKERAKEEKGRVQEYDVLTESIGRKGLISICQFELDDMPFFNF
jgi:hypothetical protein